MSECKKAVCHTIDELKEDFRDLSVRIWSNPELAFQETKAHEFLTDFFEKHGFYVERNFVLPTGFKCSYGSGDGPTVCIMCEYDALPDIGHACGHNLIAEAGAAAGVAVKMAIQEKLVDGKVVVLGTPAEEGGGGKINMINSGVLDDVDFAMMVHPFALDSVEPGILSRTTGHAQFHGKNSHASGAPWQGRNALDAAVLAYQNIACLRQQMKPADRMHAIISKGGTVLNIIPDETELKLAFRTIGKDNVDKHKENLKRCVYGAAMAANCEADLSFDDDRAYDSMNFNQTLCRLYEENGTSLGICFDKSGANLGSTDMGNVSQVVPSIHPCFSITKAPNHSPEFTTAAGSDEAQESTLKAAKAMAMTAVEVILKPEVLRAIKSDFRNTT